MNIEILKRIIREGQDLIPQIELYERPIDFEPTGNYVFVGIRQCGKSYMLYQRAQQLLREGVDIRDIVYINFDDERMQTIKSEELDAILQAHASISPNKPYLFLDEIQNVTGWEHFARRLANQKYTCYITGSNAKMLSRDIESTLGGRFWAKYVYTFTLSEHLAQKGIQLDNNWMYSAKLQGDVERSFSDYFHFGGFPELHMVVAKRIWLNEIYNKIFFSDLVVRNKVRNEQALRLTIRRLAECVKQPTAYNRISHLVTSTGITCHPNTVMDYVEYMRNACMLFSLNNYASKFAERETVKKHYFSDNGLLNIFLTDDETSLLENLCAIHLHQIFADDQLFYYAKNIEVDFFIPDEQTAIQACYSINNPLTAEIETEALLKLHKYVPLKRAVIITYNQQTTIQREDLTIEVLPIWKWLLE
ncbi:MAG: ATP-binding protein [Paludibacteraceae bacterium]|nr:ATP-binding protein [Paludibacteraceae bacterium]